VSIAAPAEKDNPSEYTPRLSATASVLLAMVRYGPKPWAELAQAGLSAAATLDAGKELAAVGVDLHLGLDEVSLIRTSLSASATALLYRLRRGPQTWDRLEARGLPRMIAIAAAGELALSGLCRVRLGPALIELETGPDAEVIPCA